MTSTVLGQILVLLDAYYGDFPLEPADAMRWWHAVKSLDDIFAKVCVMRWIYTRKYAPLPFALLETLRERKFDYTEQEQDTAEGLFAAAYVLTEEHLGDYQSYLRSLRWKARRLGAIALARAHCADCGAAADLHVHHLTYDRIGNERDEDLVVLCSACHEVRHQLRPHPGVVLYAMGQDRRPTP